MLRRVIVEGARKLYRTVGPEVEVDNGRKSFEIKREGLLFNNGTRAFYTLRLYTEVRG